jgi:predicted GIY-YIG superfamily endonuclease
MSMYNCFRVLVSRKKSRILSYKNPLEHRKGEVRSTRYRRFLKLIYFEIANTREAAVRKEEYFKSGFGRKNIKNKLKLKKALK